MTLSRHRKQRAAETQRIVAQALRESGLAPFATARGAGEAGVDIMHVEDVAVEVKAERGWRPLAWLRQAAGNAQGGEIPVVVARPDGGGPANVGTWPVMLTFDDAVRLLQLVQVLRTIADAASMRDDPENLAQYADDALRDLLDPERQEVHA